MRTFSLAVADTFQAVGPSYRLAQTGRLSLAQLKVMSAIQNCRTAALGGHVDGCDDCGYVGRCAAVPCDVNMAGLSAADHGAKRSNEHALRLSACRANIS